MKQALKNLAQPLKLQARRTLERLQTRHRYEGSRIYFRAKTRAYLDYLAKLGTLRDLPSSHAKAVREYWTPILSRLLPPPH